jgi:hypothetical protein
MAKTIVAAALALLAACAHTANHGAGDCTDYRPLCLSGYERCETTGQGCTVCTCEDNARSGELAPANIPDPKQGPR